MGTVVKNNKIHLDMNKLIEVANTNKWYKYPQLCQALGIYKHTNNKDRKMQLEALQKYCIIKKHKTAGFKITHVLTPDERLANETYESYKYYIINEIYNATTQGSTEIMLSMPKLIEQSEYVNEGFYPAKYDRVNTVEYMKELGVSVNLRELEIFIYGIEKEIKRNIKEALKELSKLSMIQVSEVVHLAKEHRIGKTKYTKVHQATSDEVAMYLKISRNTLDELGFNGKGKEDIPYHRLKDYNNLLNEKVKEQMGYDYGFHQYKIIPMDSFNQYIESRYNMQDILSSRKELNRKFQLRCLSLKKDSRMEVAIGHLMEMFTDTLINVENGKKTKEGIRKKERV